MDTPIFGRIRFPRDPEEESVDLLAYDPPESDDETTASSTSSTVVSTFVLLGNNNNQQQQKHQEAQSSSPTSSLQEPSPATQTLDRLSQDDVDLRYIHSQLEFDVAAASAAAESAVRRTTNTSTDKTEPSLKNRDDPRVEEDTKKRGDSGPSNTMYATTDVDENKPKEDTFETFLDSTLSEPDQHAVYTAAAASAAGHSGFDGLDSDEEDDNNNSTRKPGRGASTIEKSIAAATVSTRPPDSRRPVEQLDSKGSIVQRFTTLREAEEATGVPNQRISEVLNGHSQEAGGYGWRRVSCATGIVDQLKRSADTASKSTRNRSTRPPHNRRPVEQLDSKGSVVRRFATMTEAEEATGVRRQLISEVLNGHSKQAGGYGWRRVSFATGIADKLKGSADTASESTRNRSSKIQQRPVTQVDPESQVSVQTFPSIPQASEKSGIAEVLKGKGKQTEAGGFLQKRSEARAQSSAPTAAGTTDKTLERTDDTTVPALDVPTSTLSSGQPVEVLSDGNEIHAVVIDGEGLLGVVISQKKAPTSLLSALKVTPDDSDGTGCAFAASFRANDSLAHDCGLQVNDIFLNRESSGSYELMPYPGVVDLAKNGQRPITFVVARRPHANSNHPKSFRDHAIAPTMSRAATLNPVQSHSDDIAPQPGASTKRGAVASMPNQLEEVAGGELCGRASQAGVRSEASVPVTATAAAGSLSRCNDAPQSHLARSDRVSSAVTPFCAKCNGKGGTRLHHAWCPHNQHFHSSGAKDVLARMQLGAEKLGCQTCRKEYEQGRRLKELHSDACFQYWHAQASKVAAANMNSNKRKRLSQKQEEGAASMYETRPASRQMAKRKKSMNSANDRGGRLRRADLDALDAFASDDDDDDDDDDSVSVAHVSMPRIGGRNKASSQSATRNPVSRDVRSKVNEARHAKKPQQQARGRAVTPYTEDDDEESDTDDVQVFWEPSEDPWGQEGYQEGDVILISSVGTTGLGHIETLLPSLRFELDPFTTWKQYCKTHYTPKEGFQVLELRRDPLARLDWGFTVQRHEFGGACLVSSVDPVSPASIAAFLAASTERDDDSGLRLSDMLLSLNGKRIGGMMETELAVELEISGPVLTLVVSRYKLSAVVDDRVRQAENHYQLAVDQALNDQRRLGWTDLIVRSGPVLTSNLAQKASSDVTKQGEVTFADNTCIQDRTDHADGNLQDQFKSKASGLLSHPSLATPGFVQGGAPVAEVCNEDAPQLTGDDEGGKRGTDSIGFPLCSKLDSSVDNGFHQHLGGSSIMPAYQCQVFEADQTNQGFFEAPLSESGLEDAVETLAMTLIDDDYDNAWMGCACGTIHQSDVPVFWIQCDNCQSWYNVSPQCVGFDEKHAASLPSWACWGCPTSSQVTTDGNQAPTRALNASATDLVGGNGGSTRNSTSQLTTLFSLDARESLHNEGHLMPENQNQCGHSDVALARPSGNAPTEALTSLCPVESKPVDSVTAEMDRIGRRVPQNKPRKQNDGTFIRPRGPAPFGFRWDPKSGCWVTKDNGSYSHALKNATRDPERRFSQQLRKEPSESKEEVVPTVASFDGRVFAIDVGEIVRIQEHGEPEHGIAHVLATYLDARGDRFYDVKYIVGRKQKGISTQFVTPHRF